MPPLITDDIRARLIRNGEIAERLNGTDHAPDFFPVVKLFTPNGPCAWLLTELDPDDPDLARGLCDLGTGCPELQCVRLSDLENICGPIACPVERDVSFVARKTISAYAAEARLLKRIKA